MTAEPATDQETESADEEDEEADMAYKIQCPVCGDRFEQPQGLHGHLRFSHNLYDDELDEVYERAQSPEYMEFEGGKEDVDQESSGSATSIQEETEPDEEEGQSELEDLPGTRGEEARAKRRIESPVDDEEAVSEVFDWEERLNRMDNLRADLEDLDRSYDGWLGMGKIKDKTDEGCVEALEALDEIEMEVREKLGASEQDRELRRRVDQSLEKMKELVRCREQRQVIEERFEGEKAEKRIQRLDDREAKIRTHVRDEWDVGKPTENLDDVDPVKRIENGGEPSDT